MTVLAKVAPRIVLLIILFVCNFTFSYEDMVIATLCCILIAPAIEAYIDSIIKK